MVQKEIDSLAQPLSPDGRKRFDEWIASKGSLVAQAVIHSIERTFEAARAQVDATARALEGADAALLREAAQAVSVPPVTYIRPLIVSIAFLTCLVAEY